MSIRNPVERGMDRLRLTNAAGTSMAHSASLFEEAASSLLPAVRRVGVTEVRDALANVLDDFGACRTDVIILCLVYPVVGVALDRLALGYDMLPLLFPFVSGFALVGPGIALHEISRRRELGIHDGFADALHVLRSPSVSGTAAPDLLLIGSFVLWLIAADLIYAVTLGSDPPNSAASFLRDALTTKAGWTMIGVGIGVGFLFAEPVLSTSVLSFRLPLNRGGSVYTAVATPLPAVAVTPGPIALWGLIVAGGLVIGRPSLLLGLIIPVLGHATWHLYCEVVPRCPR